MDTNEYFASRFDEIVESAVDFVRRDATDYRPGTPHMDADNAVDASLDAYSARVSMQEFAAFVEHYDNDARRQLIAATKAALAK